MKFKIRPGEFKHRIYIKRSINSDMENIPIVQLVDLFNTKAKIINGHGDEYNKAGGIDYKEIKTFYIRYNRAIEVLNTDFVFYKNKKYNIIYVNNIEEANRYLEVKCEAII